MPSYPASVKVFTSKVSGATIQPVDVNDLQDEVNAIEAGILNGTANFQSSNSTILNLTVSRNSTLGSTITIGTLPYIFPATGGSTGQVLTITSTSGSTMSLGWGAPSGISKYTATSTSVSNSTAETVVLSFTVPANDMASGDLLEVTAAVLFNYASPGSPAFKWRWAWGGSQLAQQTGIAPTNAGVERSWMFRWRLQRVGTAVWIPDPAQASTRSPEMAVAQADLESGGNVLTISGSSFTASETVALKVQMPDTANANSYWKTQVATVIKYSGA